MTKKCFLFHLESSFHSQDFLDFFLDFLVMQKNDLIRKIKLISKFIKSQLGKQSIAVNILPNISAHKGNRTIKFGQLIEYNIEIFFFEQSYTKKVEKLLPDSFLENQNLAYLYISGLKFYKFCFYCMSKLRGIEMY